eukprot:4596979-Prymnesium_polylepis.1
MPPNESVLMGSAATAQFMESATKSKNTAHEIDPEMQMQELKRTTPRTTLSRVEDELTDCRLDLITRRFMFFYLIPKVCIVHASRTLREDRKRHSPTPPDFCAAPTGQVHGAPVSYTHLTLPTICSV